MRAVHNRCIRVIFHSNRIEYQVALYFHPETALWLKAEADTKNLRKHQLQLPFDLSVGVESVSLFVPIPPSLEMKDPVGTGHITQTEMK